MIEFSSQRGIHSRSVGQNRARPEAGKGSPCRDLVVIQPVKTEEKARPASALRTSSTFLALLIATADGHPQTREKRRLAPEAATRIYNDAQTRNPPQGFRLASL